MTEEKRNRLIAAVTVNVILLIAILAVLCVSQIVVMVTLDNLKKDIQEKIEYCKTNADKTEKDLEYYKSKEFLEDKAYYYGWVAEKDK